MKRAWRKISTQVRTPWLLTFRGRVDAFGRRTTRYLRRVAAGSVLVTILASGAAATLLVGSLAPSTDIPRQELSRRAAQKSGPLAPVAVADDPGAGRVSDLVAEVARVAATASESSTIEGATLPTVSGTTATVIAALQIEVEVQVAGAAPVEVVPPAATSPEVVVGTSPAGSSQGIEPTIGVDDGPASAPPVIVYPPTGPSKDGSRDDKEPPQIDDSVDLPDPGDEGLPDPGDEGLPDPGDEGLPDPGDADLPDGDEAVDPADEVIDDASDEVDEVGDAIDTPTPDDIGDDVAGTVDDAADAASDVAGDVSDTVSGAADEVVDAAAAAVDGPAPPSTDGLGPT